MRKSFLPPPSKKFVHILLVKPIKYPLTEFSITFSTDYFNLRTETWEFFID